MYQRTTNGAGLLTSDARRRRSPGTRTSGLSGLARLRVRQQRPVRRQPRSTPAPRERQWAGSELVDAQLGIMAPAASAYNATSGVWSSVGGAVRRADQVTVRYLAGLPLDASGQMPHAWRVTVARLAAAELARPICACDGTNRELYRWQFDLARTAGVGDEGLRGDLGRRFG